MCLSSHYGKYCMGLPVLPFLSMQASAVSTQYSHCSEDYAVSPVTLTTVWMVCYLPADTNGVSFLPMLS